MRVQHQETGKQIRNDNFATHWRIICWPVPVKHCLTWKFNDNNIAAGSNVLSTRKTAYAKAKWQKTHAIFPSTRSSISDAIATLHGCTQLFHGDSTRLTWSSHHNTHAYQSSNCGQRLGPADAIAHVAFSNKHPISMIHLWFSWMYPPVGGFNCFE